MPCLVAPVPGRESSTAKFIPREEGLYAVDVTYDGHPVPGSPYTVEASLPPDPTKVSLCFCSRTRPLWSHVTPHSPSLIRQTPLENHVVLKVSFQGLTVFSFLQWSMKRPVGSWVSPLLLFLSLCGRVGPRLSSLPSCLCNNGTRSTVSLSGRGDW